MLTQELRWMSSVFKVAKKLAATAFSYESPIDPMDDTRSTGSPGS